ACPPRSSKCPGTGARPPESAARSATRGRQIVRPVPQCRSGPPSSSLLSVSVSARRVEGQLITLQTRADPLLVDLARRSQRDVIDEEYVVGHPPFGDLAVEKGGEVGGGGGRAGFQLAEQDRALVPFRMRDPDDRGVGDRRMPHRDILDLDRTDPLA